MTKGEQLEKLVESFGGVMELHHWHRWLGPNNEPVPEACGGCRKGRDVHPIMRIFSFNIDEWGRIDSGFGE